MSILRHESHAAVMLSHLYNLYQEQTFCDTVIISQDNKMFHTHRVVLSGLSKFLHQVLLDSQEVSTFKLDIASPVLEVLLQFGYCGEIQVTPQLWTDVQQASIFLQMDGLSDMMSDNLDLANAAQDSLYASSVPGVKQEDSLKDSSTCDAGAPCDGDSGTDNMATLTNCRDCEKTASSTIAFDEKVKVSIGTVAPLNSISGSASPSKQSVSEKCVCVSEKCVSVSEKCAGEIEKSVTDSEKCLSESKENIVRDSAVSEQGDVGDFSGVDSDLHGKLLGKFLDTEQVFLKLGGNKKGLHSIPRGRKDNVYFLLDNTRNREKQSNNKHCDFSDDCGVWESSSGGSPKHFYLLEEGKMNHVDCRNGQIGKLAKVKGKRDFVALEPQPEKSKVVAVQRYYKSLKLNKNYKKRVTWIIGLSTPALALVEYLGIFPGLGPFGDGSKVKEYVRVPGQVQDEIKSMALKLKPKEIMKSLKNKYDEKELPSSIGAVRRAVHQCKAKADKQLEHSNIDLENIGEEQPSIRSVIKNSSNAPTIIMYMDDQNPDLKDLSEPGKIIDIKNGKTQEAKKRKINVRTTTSTKKPKME